MSNKPNDTTDNLPSAEDFIQARMTKGWVELYDHEVMFATETMIKFAQMHVERALKKASEEAVTNAINDSGVDPDSILNAYPVSNIK